MKNLSGRRFGIEVGSVLVVIALLLSWRASHPTLRSLLLAGGIALLALAVGRPVLLVPLARAWQAFGLMLARVTTPIVLAAVYLVILTPMGIARRSFARSPLARDRNAQSYWVQRDRATPAERRARMERQF